MPQEVEEAERVPEPDWLREGVTEPEKQPEAVKEALPVAEALGEAERLCMTVALVLLH